MSASQDSSLSEMARTYVCVAHMRVCHAVTVGDISGADGNRKRTGVTSPYENRWSLLCR